MSIRELVLPLCDALAMDMSYGIPNAQPPYNTKLRGKQVRTFVDVEAVRLDAVLEVVDSVCYSQYGVSGVLVRVLGNLYLLVLYDRSTSMEEPTLTAFVLDGSKLMYNTELTTVGSVEVFEQNWSRKGLYKKLVKGVVGMYSKTMRSDDWSEQRSARAVVSCYLNGRSSGLHSAEAMRLARVKYGGCGESV